MPNSSPVPGTAVWGLLVRKPRWGLSWPARFAALALFALAGIVVFLGIHPFLATTDRVKCRTLVMEGWVHEFAVEAAAREFRDGNYTMVYVTGGPGEGSGPFTNIYNTAASVGAARLRRAGVPPDCVQMVPAQAVDRDRTYNSAVALRDWLQAHHQPIPDLNIVTEDVHARRTRLMFQEALGGVGRVGIIAVPSPDYDPAHWWRYSEGVRQSIDEAIAYVYARFFFNPA